jgi:integrase
MPWTRQLPSGLWASTVRFGPNPNDRITESDESRAVIHRWALDLEAEIRRGEFLDPRLARKPLAEVWETYADSRSLEQPSRERDESHWKNWVAPRWGSEPIGKILKPDVQKWVNGLEEQGVGGWTIIAALNVLKAALELAIDAGWIRANAARRVRPPVPPAHVDRVLDPDEETAILDRLDELFPGRRDARLFIETKMDTAGRWEEVAAIRREAVNLPKLLISLGPVMQRDGTIREYPKGARSRHDAGFRDAPISPELGARLRPVLLATAPGGLVFTAPEGGPMRYSTWHDRVWQPTIHGEPEKILRRAPAGAYDAVSFGAWLDAIRERVGATTDRALAVAAGVQPSMIANWRADRFGPTRGTDDKLAAGLGIEPRDVYVAAGLIVAGVPGLGLVDPQPTPHDCRHSTLTRYADAGMALHDRMALAGHKDVRSSQRYTHSGDERFDKARAALRRARGGS